MRHVFPGILYCLLVMSSTGMAQQDNAFYEDEFIEEAEEDTEDYIDEEEVPIGVPLKADPSKHKVAPLTFLWSDGSDIAPALSPDGRYIIFQSNRQNENRFTLYETIKGNKGWAKPRPIILDKKATFEGQPFFSGRAGYIYYTAVSNENYKKKENINIATDIWFTRFRQGRWSKPIHLPAPVNTEHTELTPWVSYDGRRLYFSSNRPGGYGGFDIWISDREEDGWGEPYNAGSHLNSGADEIYPRIHPDNSVLYFSSNRSDGVGGYDIYLSRRYGNRFKKPENAGSFVNTRTNDFINSIPASSKYAYISRGPVGQEKIYKLDPIPEFMRPSSVVIAQLIVLEEGSKIPLPFKIEVKNVYSKRIILQKDYTPASTEPYSEPRRDSLQALTANYFKKTGLFVSLPTPGKFNIFITSKKHLFVDTNLSIGQNDNDEVKKIIYLTPLKIGSKVALRAIHFYGNEAAIKEESKPNLLRVARYLSNNSHIVIELRGHTSRGGGSAKNRLQLSRARAQTVRDALVEYGIDKSRISTKGFGARKPLYPHRSKRAHLNRRVEFVVKNLLVEKNKKRLKR